MSNLEPVIKYLTAIKGNVQELTDHNTLDDYNTLVDNITTEHDVQMTLLKRHEQITREWYNKRQYAHYKSRDSWNVCLGKLGDSCDDESIMEIFDDDKKSGS